MVMVGDHRDVQLVPPPSPQGGGADEAQRVGSENVEANGVVDPLDMRRQEKEGDRPPEPPADRQPVDPPVRHFLRDRLPPGQEHFDSDPQPPQRDQNLPLVGLAAGGRLGRQPAVGGADAHAGGHVASERSWAFT